MDPKLTAVEIVELMGGKIIHDPFDLMNEISQSGLMHQVLHGKNPPLDQLIDRWMAYSAGGFLIAHGDSPEEACEALLAKIEYQR